MGASSKGIVDCASRLQTCSCKSKDEELTYVLNSRAPSSMLDGGLNVFFWTGALCLSAGRFFFSSSVADVALKARSLHEHKLDRHLYKDKSCPLEQANRYEKHTTTKTNQTRRPANPPARLQFRPRKQRSKQQDTKNNKNGARAQTEHPPN